MCDENCASRLILILKDDIKGQLLAEYVSKVHEGELKESKRKHNKSIFSFTPAVTPVDIVLMCLIKLSGSVSVEDFRRIIVSEFPEYKYALNYSLLRMRELGLISFDGGSLKLNELSVRILETAVKSVDIVEEKVERDSLLSTLSAV